MDINFFWREKYLKSKHQERFNLLLLEPGEIYFEDFSVYYYSSELKENEAIKRRQKGRLKICSKSLVFEPADTNYPIIKFLYKNVINISPWNGSLLSRLETKGDVIFLETNACTHLKEGNVIAPYKHIKKKSSYYFSLNFVPSSSVLPQIDQLLRAHTLNPHTADEMIKTIIAARQAVTKFDCSWVEDLYETIVLETAAWKISPLVCNPGTLLLTSKQLYFQPFNNVEPEPVIKVRLNTIRSVLKRRYLLRHVGLEIMGNQDKHDVYFIFTNSQERDLAHAKLIEQKEVKIEQDQQDNMTLKWQNGVVSNFEYLLYLNSLADRSFNDLTQYPVFPWVISDYTSSTLDLNCPQTFRDLSKPIGALNQQRLKQLKERCNCMPEPKFLYGSHYSSPSFVLFYLVRVAPEYMLCLQNGKFDHADRLFSSILPTWKNCCSGHSDFKEVIPEFYNSDGSFLLNSKKLDLGIKQDGSKIGDVQLPTWASDAEDFVKKCREALECDYVSNEIHNWIDLIFGYKQTGQEAWKADNVFYYLTYEGAIDLDSIDSAREKHCLEAQIMEFGQTPKQLFFKPHPRRKPLQIPLEIGNIVLQVNTENPNDEKNDTENKEEIIISVNNKVKDEKSNKSMESINSLHWISHLKEVTSIKLHKCAVLCMDISRDGNTIYSVSQDSQLKIYSVKEGKQIRSISLSSMPLSQCKLLEEENKMIVTSWDSQMYVYSLDYGRVIEQHHVHDDAVSGLCLPSSERVVTSSWDSTVKLWKRERNKKQLNLIHELEHDTEVLCCDCFLDNIVAGTKDGFLSLWYEDSMTSQINLHCDALTKVLFNEAGDRVLACSLDGSVKVIDVISNVEVFLKSLQNVQITDASWDGELVVVATDKGDVMLLDLNKNEPIQAAHVQTGGLKSLAVSRDQRILVTGGNKGYLTIFTADETNNS